MNNNIAVELKNLSKIYGSHAAVDSMNLTLEANKIYGLLGRNGAGKTTMLNILTGRIFASGGEAIVFGNRAYENIETLKKICFIEEKGFYANGIRINQVLRLAADIYPGWDAEFAAELIRMFELDTKKTYKQLSRGMESILGLIIGLASRAPLTIFDEPSLGLDAVVREKFYDILIEDFSQNPRTVIISTHLIDEVSRVFEEIIIVDRGRVLIRENSDELRQKCFFLSGNPENVRRAAEGNLVLTEESFLGTLTLTVWATDRIRENPDLLIQPVPLQKLFMLMNESHIQKKLKERGIIE